MRLLSRYTLLAGGLLGWGCRSDTTNLVSTLPPPQRLAYQLDPSGTPGQPAGILLVWDDVQSGSLGSYRIYSRGSTSGGYGLRGETSSNTFHDNGVPHLQYYVTAADVYGGESEASNVITVDERLQLPQPASLSSISLNQAIHLQWVDNAALFDTARFNWYRVYSMPYDLDHAVCKTQPDSIFLEGTTVSDEFLATLLTNGVPRCFGVSAISVEGYESLWSPLWHDTPRPDARNVLVSALEVNAAQSGFRFWNDVNRNGRGEPGELGLVQPGNGTDIDFWVHLRASDSTLWIVPQFAGDSVQLYDSTQAVPDLTSIDFAPASGYTRNMIQAVPGFGYVFQRNENGQYHYAALRVTAVGRRYVIFDWSAQTDPGNPELRVVKNGL
jgi:hypothetical protein